MDGCVFCGIVDGKIPAKVVYQDDNLVVFHNIKPEAPLHLLIVPKEHFSDFTEAKDETLLRVKEEIRSLVAQFGLSEKGYRIVVNGGTAKHISHLHFHFLGEVSLNRPN